MTSYGQCVVVYTEPSYNIKIIIIGFIAIILFGLAIGGYIAATTAVLRQVTAPTTVVVVTGGGTGSAASQPFSGKYIRSTSGYWTDIGAGVIVFSVTPEQTWSFNGRKLSNYVTDNLLFTSTNTGPVVLVPPPPSLTPLFGYTWVFNGLTLSLAYTQSQLFSYVITDTSNNPTTGQIVLSQIATGSVSDNTKLYLS